MAETVCHDIKTPLARLKFINHMSKQETLAQSKGQIENNLNDIEANIYDYLRLAKNEYREQPLNITSTELLREVKALTEVFIEDKDRTIHLNIAEGIVINADIKLLARAITNLVSNALRFCQHNIWITASVEHKTLLLAVEDDGLGWDQTSSNDDIIPEHHQIGLAVVRRVTEQHDGQMAISKSVYGGAKVALHLPIVMSQ
ncbi:sensor histidine kinase [Psychrosphaera algicola]|uniref:histidine kinase n=2 Tax=Psychrosphaera TaxID=907197 RepID=A0ABT5FFN9_9GAMM|nr:ATP-binding protein [Psychrosphaera sp. G1-22]MDC2890333.1 ATP-binding protein [Psychrosphaera sp. G1-22]